MISRTSVLYFVVVCISCSVLLLAFAPVPSHANEDEEKLYLIRNIKTETNHPDPVTAKKNVFAAAQKDAFQRLLLKITPNSVAPSIPPPTQKTIDTLIRDITFLEEKIDENFYYARLDIRFQPETVKAYLASFGVVTSVSQLTRVLVIPLYQEAGITRLWERNNLWLSAWEQHNELTTSGIKILTPRASLQDMNLLNHRDVIQLNEKKMEQLALLYDTPNFIVTFAKMTPEIQKSTVKIDFQALPFIRGTSNNNIKFTNDTLPIDAIPQALKQATQKITQGIALTVAKKTINKSIVASKSGPQQIYLVSVPLNSLDDLVKIQKQFEKITEFERLVAKRVNKKQALFSLVSNYQSGQVIAILKSYAIDATSDFNNSKFIKILPQ